MLTALKTRGAKERNRVPHAHHSVDESNPTGCKDRCSSSVEVGAKITKIE